MFIFFSFVGSLPVSRGIFSFTNFREMIFFSYFYLNSWKNSQLLFASTTKPWKIAGLVRYNLSQKLFFILSSGKGQFTATSSRRYSIQSDLHERTYSSSESQNGVPCMHGTLAEKSAIFYNENYFIKLGKFIVLEMNRICFRFTSYRKYNKWKKNNAINFFLGGGGRNFLNNIKNLR